MCAVQTFALKSPNSAAFNCSTELLNHSRWKTCKMSCPPQPSQSIPNAIPPQPQEARTHTIRDGEEGGLISQTEFIIAETVSKLKTVETLRKCNNEYGREKRFYSSEISANSMQQIEYKALQVNEGGTVWLEGVENRRSNS